jgi:regulator-associated protein of mTOR
MVSAFRGLNEVIQLRQGSGVVTDWKQSAGTLLVGGDSHVVKVWDAQTETQGLVCLENDQSINAYHGQQDLDTNSDSPVTALVSDHAAAQTFIASFADGKIKVFDRRLEDEDAIVRIYSEHTSWVQNVRWHPTLSGQLLSARYDSGKYLSKAFLTMLGIKHSLDGQVKLWDLRGSDNAIKTWDAHPNLTGISAFDVHSTTGVFATYVIAISVRVRTSCSYVFRTSAINPAYWRSQRITVHSLTRTDSLSAFNISTGLTMHPARVLPSPFIPRLSSLVFHPTEMLYGVGEPDGTSRPFLLIVWPYH